MTRILQSDNWSSITSNIKMMKTIFLTFGDGSPEFRAAATRLMEQAKNIRVFSAVLALNHNSLMQASPEYEIAHKAIMKLDSYPTYFRAAKSWVIQAGLLGRFGNFDVVCYADAGCEIVVNSVTRRVLKNNLNKAFLHGGLAEQLSLPEKHWTKKKTIDYFHPSDSHALSGQIQSGLSYWRVEERNVRLVNEWCDLSNPKLDLWQDPISKDSEEEYFVDHRHDQSIFSLLWKQAGLPVKPISDKGFLRLPNVRSASTPILTIRNRTGNTKLTRLSKSNSIAIVGLVINTIAVLRDRAIKIILGQAK